MNRSVNGPSMAKTPSSVLAKDTERASLQPRDTEGNSQILVVSILCRSIESRWE